MPNSVQHREGKFLIRILADQHADVWEINEDNIVVHSISNDFGDDRTVEYVSLICVIDAFDILCFDFLLLFTCKHRINFLNIKKFN